MKGKVYTVIRHEAKTWLLLLMNVMLLQASMWFFMLPNSPLSCYHYQITKAKGCVLVAFTHLQSEVGVLWCCFCPGVGSCWRPTLQLLLHFFWAQMDWPTTSGFHPGLTIYMSSQIPDFPSWNYPHLFLFCSRRFSLNSTNFNDRNISEKGKT